MSETSKAAREAMKSKAHRMASGDPHQKVDASSWSPSEALDTEAKTGMRPVSRRQFKRGGKVAGEHEKARADRKPRKAGGRSLPDALANVDQKEANEDRDGTKHVGGMKKGGRAHKDAGGNAGDAVPTQRMNFQGGPSQMSKAEGLKRGGRSKRASGGPLSFLGPFGGLIPMAIDGDFGGGGGDKGPNTPSVPVVKPAKRGGSVSDGEIEGTRPKGGREARKHGGRTSKGKMSVNIVIAPGGGDKPVGPPMGGGMPMPAPHPIVPPPMPMGAPPGMPPGAGGPPPMMPPGAGMPPGGPPPMPPGMMGRKDGGRVARVAHILGEKSAGAGGGLARLIKSKSESRSW